MKLKLLYCFILVINVSFSQFSQNLIRNGDFELRAYGQSVNNTNPDKPCQWGGIAQADVNSAFLQTQENGAGGVEYWLSFGNSLFDAERQATIFDTRSICDDTPANINNTNICYSGNCAAEKNRVGIPNNFYQDNGSTPTPHRLATDGNLIIGRYVGLQTQGGIYTNQGIQTKMSEAIECEAVYNLNFYAIKKLGNTVKLNVRFSVTGKWNDPIAYNDQGDINDEFVVSETTTWQEINRQYKFQDNFGARVWMMIRITKNGAPQGRVLLDDFSFTKAPCNPNNPCSSLSNCDLDGVQVFPLVAFPNNLTITGLENVNQLEVTFYTQFLIPVRHFNITNPPYTWIYDGRFFDGTPLPLDVYLYKIKVSNECSSREYQGITPVIHHPIFNVEGENNVDVGFVLRNLDNVNLLKLTISNGIGQAPLFYREYIDPPNRIGWIGLDNNGQPIANSVLYWEAEVSNNCATQTFTGNYSHVNEVQYYDFLHDPPPVNKPPFDCGPQFSMWSKPYGRPPVKCCDAQLDIYLSNVNIGFDADYRAINNIYIGDNVVVDEFSEAVFWAGNSVEILPNAQGVEISSATIIIAPCEKMMNNSNEDDYIDNNDYIEIEEEPTALITNQSNTSFSISPNPTSDEFNITSLNDINIEFIEIFNSQGLLVFSNRVSSLRTTINVSSFTKGIYICKVMIGDELHVEKLIIN